MQKLESNIKKLYWINLFSSTQFQSVVGTIFLLSKGFNLAQLFLFGSVYAVAALISEIPTGIYSDKIGRKNSLILSTLIEIPAIIVVILSNSFWLILAMNAVFGIAASFNSGTDTATLYDTLKGIGKENEFKKINGKLKWLGAWGGAIGGIFGGVIAKFSLAYAWWAWVVALILILITKTTLIEPPVHRVENEKLKLWSHFNQSISKSFKGEAGFYILYYILIWLFFWVGYTLWQPYLQLTGLPVIYFGFFYAGISLISGYVSKQSHLIEKRIGVRNSLLLIPILLASAFFLQSYYVLIFSFVFIAIQAVASGYFGPLLDDYVNSRIPSENRATVLSVQNMFSRLTFTVFSPFIGYLIDIYSFATAFRLMGLVLLVLALIFYYSYAFYNKPHIPSQS